MNLKLFDFVIIGLFIGIVVGIVKYVQRYVKSVSDFLAGNRLAGRYLLTVAGEMGSIGAVSVIAFWEASYHSGWGATWWRVLMQPFILIMMLAGWVVYRYRQTRALTLAQFFEQRYSRKFRVAAGLLAFMAGTLNYAIFPSVAARFLVYVCGIPEYPVDLAGVPVSLSYALIMAALLGLGLWITLRGGQVGIMLSDGLQNIMLVAMVMILSGYLLSHFSWLQIGEALKSAPNAESASMINPFKTGATRDFNIWFYIIAIFASFYGRMAWQGNSGYNAAAKSPHEARMAGVLAILRSNVLMVIMGFFGLIAYTLMHHPDFSETAGVVWERLLEIGNPALRKQMTVPIAIGTLMPVGLLGCLVAVIVSMAITTDDTYLHSWGSIFVQDVIMPFRKKPFTPEGHMRALRWSICGVALFAYGFSLFFRHTGYILMFFALTGSIFVAGAGACIIGGLYWKRGTTGGAWAALMTGVVFSVAGMCIQQQPFYRLPFEVRIPAAVSVSVNQQPAVKNGDLWTFRLPFWRQEEWQNIAVTALLADGAELSGVVQYAYGRNQPASPASLSPGTKALAADVFPETGSFIPVGNSPVQRLYYRVRSLTGQMLFFISIVSSLLMYTVVSLAGRRIHDLDRLLHRKQYAAADLQGTPPVRGWRAVFGITNEFTRGDKITYFGVIAWSYGWVVANLVIIAINLVRVRSDDFWIQYFKWQLYLFLGATAITVIWFGTGAVRNAVELCRGLAARTRDISDDGWVDHEGESSKK